MRSKRPGRDSKVEDALAKFDDACIRKLASIAKLPATADLGLFARGVREAVSTYIGDAARLTRNELHAEIEAIHRAAEQEVYEEVARLLEAASAETIALLQTRADRLTRPDTPIRQARAVAVGRGGEILSRKLPQVGATFSVPAPSDLRDETRREQACAMIASLCRMGGKWTKGRKRSNGRRSDSWEWKLFAPKRARHFAKRKAEHNFVKFLRLACIEAGTVPALTASRAKPGPFARLVQECFVVMRVGADAINAINELAKDLRSEGMNLPRPP